MSYALYAIAAFIALGSILAITSVGKPRKPLTGSVAAAIVVIDSAIVVILVLAALRR